MEFNEVLFKESQDFRSKYPDLINLGIEVDEYLISIFDSSFADKYHQGLLRLINALRRNFLLSSFLIESKQGNVGVQAMRTMIESGELVSLYLLNSEVIYTEILNSKGKPILDELIKKYAISGIAGLKNNHIQDKAKGILESKTTLNNLLTHVNPAYNLVFASGFDFSDSSGIVAGYTDGNDSANLSHYVILVGIYLELVNFISLLGPQTSGKIFLSREFKDIPDFQIEKYITKYVPHWLK